MVGGNFLKYEICKFPIRYSKTKARESCEKIKTLEENLKTLKQDLKNDKNILNYNINKEELSMIYDAITGMNLGKNLVNPF